jgi:hypothetical protein
MSNERYRRDGVSGVVRRIQVEPGGLTEREDLAPSALRHVDHDLKASPTS